MNWVKQIPQIPEIPRSPQTAPEDVLWVSLLGRENIYCVAYRLCLGPEGSVESWRQFVIWLASTELFWQAKPRGVRLTRRDWERWRGLKESSRKRLDLLRKLLYGVRIWQEPTDGRY